nr:potassium channel family protein [uncultured Sphingomonas sp.]
MPLRDLIHGLIRALRDPSVRGLLALSLTLITIASLFYNVVEGWRMIDSIYFSVITIATIGYGDFAPKTDAGKIFTIFYVLIGLGIFVAAASAVANTIINDGRDRKERMMGRDRK